MNVPARRAGVSLLQAAAADHAGLHELARTLGPAGLGRLIASEPISAEAQSALDQVPSEATPTELQFLYNFMRMCWSGRDVVLEIGPYLGGTTRSLGMGMSHSGLAIHPRLLTVDKFDKYRRPEELVRAGAPLSATSPLKGPIEDELNRGGWRKLFEFLHADTTYSRFLEIVEDRLPDRPVEPAPQALAKALAGVDGVSFALIDGCLSWTSVRSFMMTAIGKMKSESWIVVRGYGRHTCFWLPVFFEVFATHFSLAVSVSGTSGFIYDGKLSAGEIAKTFPERPDQFNEARYNGLFSQLYRAATESNDARAMVTLAVQHAAALATIGNGGAARAILDPLSQQAAFGAFRSMFTEALVAPTFTPDGPVYLDKLSGSASAKAVPAAPLAGPVAEAICNICGSTNFVPGFRGRMTAVKPPMCADCKTVERHRAIRRMYTPLQPLLKNWRALHFAPERSVDRAWFKQYRGSSFGQPDGLDMMKTGLPAGSFDIVMSNHVLEHVSDDIAALEESLRVVGGNGVVHVCVPSPTFRWQTDDWGFADKDKNEHFRDYGADFAQRVAARLPEAKIMAVAGEDPVTKTPELVYFVSRSEDTLKSMSALLLRTLHAIVRVA